MPAKPSKPTVSKLAERFTLASGTLVHRLISAHFGEVGSLKTTFMLGMPKQPKNGRQGLLVIDGDFGMEGLIEERIANGEEIYRETFSSNVSELREITNDKERQDAAEAIATRIEDAYYYAIDNGIRSIGIDKESQYYDIVKYAVLGGKESDNANRFYPVNQRLAAMIEYAKTTDINLMFLQGMTTPWGQELKDNGKMGGKPLKTRVRKGWKQIEEQVNINVEHVMRKNDDGEMEFFLNVGKARGYGGRAVQNTEIPYVEFPEFATAVFPDTEQEDWL